MEPVDILLAPIISEKSTDLANPEPGRGRNAKSLNPPSKYVFRVNRRANKIQIKQAVEARFGVHVIAVNTITMPAKEKGAGYVRLNKRRRGHQPPWKKAIVTLQPGEKIEDFFGAV
jgi:large subunit ribosomal protein L23